MNPVSLTGLPIQTSPLYWIDANPTSLLIWGILKTPQAQSCRSDRNQQPGTAAHLGHASVISTTYMVTCGDSAPFAFSVPHRGSRACLSWRFVSGVAGRGAVRAGALAGTDPPLPNLRGDLWAYAVASRQEIVPRRQRLPSRLLPVEGQTLPRTLVNSSCGSFSPSPRWSQPSRSPTTSSGQAMSSTSRILPVEGALGAPK